MLDIIILYKWTLENAIIFEELNIIDILNK